MNQYKKKHAMLKMPLMSPNKPAESAGVWINCIQTNGEQPVCV